VIVDASAILAVIFREPGYERLVTTLAAAELAAVGTPTLTEAGIVLEARLEASAHGVLERILDEFGIEEVRFGEVHWREAVDAFRRFGKGRHPAGLNFGDCLTYAVARLTGEPLLCVGDDFPRTDLELVPLG
jgi:ribonuclease VapC